MAVFKISDSDKNKLKNLTNEKKEFVKIPAGDYEVRLTSMKCKEYQPDDKHPEEYNKLILAFEILVSNPADGSDTDYVGETLYYSQELTAVWKLRKANQFIQSLKSQVALDPDRFVVDGEFDLELYNELLEEIYDDITARGVEYHIARTPQKNNPQYTEDAIAEVFD